MPVKLLLFAGLAERLGTRTLELPGPCPLNVAALRAQLGAQHAALSGAIYRVSVNRTYASESDALAEGDEIALIPPVSGG